MGFSWRCGYCGHYATITNVDTKQDTQYLHGSTTYGDVYIGFASIKCPNKACREVTLKTSLLCKDKQSSNDTLSEVVSWNLLPASNAKPQPDYIPAPIREDYIEACLIVGKSPKASATLARRCLQGMIRDFWNVSDKTLFKEINALKEKVDPEVWDAIDSVRKVGNIGAHMEQDINVIVDVDADEASLLIELVEQLFDEWYVKRHQRTTRMSKIKDLADSKSNDRKVVISTKDTSIS
jgi:hypothetical protein